MSPLYFLKKFAECAIQIDCKLIKKASDLEAFH